MIFPFLIFDLDFILFFAIYIDEVRELRTSYTKKGLHILLLMNEWRVFRKDGCEKRYNLVKGISSVRRRRYIIYSSIAIWAFQEERSRVSRNGIVWVVFRCIVQQMMFSESGGKYKIDLEPFSFVEHFSYFVKCQFKNFLNIFLDFEVMHD